MTKLLLIITAAVLLAAAVFGVQNRNAFIADRKARLSNNKEMDAIWKQIKDEEEGKLNVAYERLYAAEQLLAQHKADLDQTNINIATLDKEISKIETDMIPLDREITKINTAIEEMNTKLSGIFGGVVTSENVGKKIAELESRLDDTKQELAAKQADVEIASTKVANNEAIIARAEKRQADRLVAIKNNALEGTITAVNNDWGFAVASLGKTSGVTPESEFIVKRGAQRVGTLGVVSVQDRQSVLDIRQKSLKGTIQPGDRVIFEQTAQ